MESIPLNRATISVFRFAESVANWMEDDQQSRERFREWKMIVDNDQETIEKAEETTIIEYAQYFYNMLHTTKQVVEAVKIIYNDIWFGQASITIEMPMAGGDENG